MSEGGIHFFTRFRPVSLGIIPFGDSRRTMIQQFFGNVRCYRDCPVQPKVICLVFRFESHLRSNSAEAVVGDY